MPGLLERYPGVRFDVQGESDESAKTGRSIVRNVAGSEVRVRDKNPDGTLVVPATYKVRSATWSGASPSCENPSGTSILTPSPFSRTWERFLSRLMT